MKQQPKPTSPRRRRHAAMRDDERPDDQGERARSERGPVIANPPGQSLPPTVATRPTIAAVTAIVTVTDILSPILRAEPPTPTTSFLVTGLDGIVIATLPTRLAATVDPGLEVGTVAAATPLPQPNGTGPAALL
ncbi:hypothetical protein QQX98_008241 [Neonectria punicea]|uniref:Uncharacterized protein n=1 Tax=Neonectria punicea TaxID=979145 RepID=A0ABR1GVM2_9HYPO